MEGIGIFMRGEEVVMELPSEQPHSLQSFTGNSIFTDLMRSPQGTVDVTRSTGGLGWYSRATKWKSRLQKTRKTLFHP